MGHACPVVAAHLRTTLPEAELIGLHTGHVTPCLTTPGPLPDTQHLGDLPALFDGVDAARSSEL